MAWALLEVAREKGAVKKKENKPDPHTDDELPVTAEVGGGGSYSDATMVQP